MFHHFGFKVMSVQTQKALGYFGDVRYKTTQLRCSLTTAFLALVTAGAPSPAKLGPKPQGGTKFKVVLSCSAESRFS